MSSGEGVERLRPAPRAAALRRGVAPITSRAAARRAPASAKAANDAVVRRLLRIGQACETMYSCRT